MEPARSAVAVRFATVAVAGGLLLGCGALVAAGEGVGTGERVASGNGAAAGEGAATGPGAAPSAADAGPFAQEAATTRAVCGSRCHSIDLVVGAAKSYDDWHETVQKMLDRGAVASDEQLQEVMDYLYVTATTIDVNAAPPEDLALQLGLTDEEVRVVEARRRARRFTGLDDFAAALRASPSRFATKSRLMLFGR